MVLIYVTTSHKAKQHQEDRRLIFLSKVQPWRNSSGGRGEFDNRTLPYAEQLQISAHHCVFVQFRVWMKIACAEAGLEIAVFVCAPGPWLIQRRRLQTILLRRLPEVSCSCVSQKHNRPRDGDRWNTKTLVVGCPQSAFAQLRKRQRQCRSTQHSDGRKETYQMSMYFPDNSGSVKLTNQTIASHVNKTCRRGRNSSNVVYWLHNYMFTLHNPQRMTDRWWISCNQLTWCVSCVLIDSVINPIDFPPRESIWWVRWRIMQRLNIPSTILAILKTCCYV